MTVSSGAMPDAAARALPSAVSRLCQDKSRSFSSDHTGSLAPLSCPCPCPCHPATESTALPCPPAHRIYCRSCPVLSFSTVHRIHCQIAHGPTLPLLTCSPPNSSQSHPASPDLFSTK